MDGWIKVETCHNRSVKMVHTPTVVFPSSLPFLHMMECLVSDRSGMCVNVFNDFKMYI